jgi:hypothetical protein
MRNNILAYHDGYYRSGVRFNEEPPIMAYMSTVAFEEMMSRYKSEGHRIIYADNEEALEVEIVFT